MGYEIVIVGDREFRSVELAHWLQQNKVYFALRQKQGNYIKLRGQEYQKLSELGLAPGMKLFLTGVNFTKKKGFGQFSLAAYWKRKYRGKSQDEGWYILTNLSSLSAALKAYRARSGIEAMFKDCKTGGYNLEASKASVERLTSLVLLIALAYTCAGLRGQAIKSSGQQALYRSSERIEKNDSTAQQFLGGFVRADVDCRPRIGEQLGEEFNDDSTAGSAGFFCIGLRAMALIQADF